ncbi:hypothetical protein [Sphingomonas sp.]|jgi:hypothetical protein|uniref:hypothetical protein n=1 Tax=Sphingomonas sp. TaxID=28214 RepID=UPI00356304B7
MAAINAILPDLRLPSESKPLKDSPPMGEGLCCIERMRYPNNKYPTLERERAKPQRADGLEEAVRFDFGEP